MTESGVGRVFLCKCQGGLDGNGATPEEVIQHASRSGAKFLIVDATEAVYVDSPGVRWLLKLRTLVEGMGKGLRIVARSKSPVSRNLQILQVDIDRFDSLATAWRTPWSLQALKDSERAQDAVRKRAV